MSRTTTALKRLGVPGLAAVTLVAGLPLFLGTASAAHITGLELTPNASSDAAGVCVPYTIQLQFATAAQAQVETVDVNLTETGTPSTTQDVDFCTAATGTAQPATPGDVTDSGAAGTADHAEFTTDATGKVTFGVIANMPGTAQVQAFYETTDNDTFNAGEFQDVSTQTFTAGGTPGSNANQDAANFVEVVSAGEPSPATATVTTTTDTDTVVEGEARTYRVFVGQDNDTRLAGVTVNFAVNSSVDSADRATAVFGVTDNNGIATGTITYPARTESSGTTSTDTVRFFVNQTGVLSTPGEDAGEPGDTLTATVRDAAGQQNRTVTLVPLTEGSTATNYSTSGDAAVNPATDKNRTFRAVVDAPSTGPASTVNTELAFGVTGGSGDETVTPVECSTADYDGAAGDTSSPADTNNSFCDVVVNDPTPTVGQTLTVTVTVRGTSAADTATLAFRNQPDDARNITLTPETVTVAPNTAQQLTARVVDVDGNGVQGVDVVFTENGAGAFRNGSSTAFATTNAQGVATIEVISLPGETGTTTVTATIDAAATDCDQAANTGTDPQGNTLNTTTNTGAAGNCSDTSTVTFGTASPSPTGTASPSPTGTGSPGPVGCPATPPTVTLEFGTINATGSSGVTVSGAPANSEIELLAYSQPSTTYRVVRRATINNDGDAAQFRIVPPTNTRLYAQVVGCDTDEVRFSKVLNVRTTISLNVVRNGTRDYTFSGDSLPARPGGLIISLYRVTNDGRQILTSQVRANASNGDWVIRRVFTGTGRFGFVARTGQDLQNAPGSSNVRSLLVF